jgi:uncharacterized protein YukE
MSAIQGDPAELERAASALGRTSSVLTAEAKNLRSAAGGIPRFTGRDADQFRNQIEQLARVLTQQAETVAKQSQSLRRLAQDLRNLRLR